MEKKKKGDPVKKNTRKKEPTKKQKKKKIDNTLKYVCLVIVIGLLLIIGKLYIYNKQVNITAWEEEKVNEVMFKSLTTQAINEAVVFMASEEDAELIRDLQLTLALRKEYALKLMTTSPEAFLESVISSEVNENIFNNMDNIEQRITLEGEIEITSGEIFLRTEEKTYQLYFPNQDILNDIDSGANVVANGYEVDNIFIPDTLSNNENFKIVSSSTSAEGCVKNNPSLTLLPSSATGKKGEEKPYTLNIKNNDTEGCQSITYKIETFLPSGFTSIGEVTSGITLAPGSSSSQTINITPKSTVNNGVYNFKIAITYNSQTYILSTIYNVINLSDAPPTVTISGLINDGTVLADGNTKFSAVGSHFAGVARIYISIGDKLVATCTNKNECIYNINSVKIGKGEHILSVEVIANNTDKTPYTKSIKIIKR